MKNSILSFSAGLLCLITGAANATIIVNHNGSSINYGTSWDTPPQQVEQVLSGLAGSEDLTLTLMNGFGASDVEAWSGTGAVSIILEELAGYRNNTTFGWYDTTNTANNSQIFTGAANPGASMTLDFGSLMNFGFYIDPNGISGNRMYTQNQLNTHNDYQVAIFKIEELANQYILGWEDLDLNGSTGGDRDYQDMIVRVTIRTASVPEPASVALLALGLLGLAAFTRRRSAINP